MTVRDSVSRARHPAGGRGQHPAHGPRSPAPLEPDAIRLAGVVGATLASASAGLGMLVLRLTFGVRSIPERLMEWLLLFVPPSLFEAALQRLGFDAKRYALYAAIVLLMCLLIAFGYAVLQREWTLKTIAIVGVGFWLVVMLVVMPLTSAGVFAMALLDGQSAAICGYLAVGLSYAAVLGAARAWISAGATYPFAASTHPLRRADRATPSPGGLQSADRRAVMTLMGSAGIAYLATYAATLLFPRSTSLPSILLVDPQEPIPSGGIDPPNIHPQSVASPVTSLPKASPTPEAAAVPALPEPAAVRELARDKDGAVLPSGRARGQLASPITTNTDFYIVTKNAAGDPLLHPGDWRLVVDGEVARSFQLDYATLRKLPAVQVTKTLECISNAVGKPELAPFGAELISTARWTGARVSDVLQLTGGPKPGAEWMAVLAADEYTTALPLNAAMDPETLLVYEMNGEVLPREHGYPARMLLPDRYGMKSAKWVIGLRPMRREFLDWYGQRHWSKDGIVRTMCRIDAPAPGASPPPGPTTVSGIAYAGIRGVKRVEYSEDGGETWREAALLEAAAGRDCWVRWHGELGVQPGHKIKLVARATDGTDTLQVEAFTLPEPDGGTGWPSIEVG